MTRWTTATALALILVPLTAHSQSVSMGAPFTVNMCGVSGPNAPPMQPNLWVYLPGMAVHWSITIAPGSATPVTGGVYEFRVTGDWELLSCDAARMTLPPGAIVSFCSQGAGLPLDGVIRVENIEIPANGTVAIGLEADIPLSAKGWNRMSEESTFSSPQTGLIRSNVADILVRDSVPFPTESTLTVEDVNGGDVVVGDDLHYLLELKETFCFLQNIINLVEPLPPEVTFNGFTLCEFHDCWYDPVLHQIHADGTYEQNPIVELAFEFDAQIGSTARAGARVCTQAITRGFEFSDDPAVAGDDSPTCVQVQENGQAALEFEKIVRDAGNGDGHLDIGELVEYELTISNPTLQPVTDAHVIDLIPAGLDGFDPTSVTVTPSTGVNLSQNQPAGLGSGIMEWDDLTVPGQSSVTISFSATVLPTAASRLCNQADLTSTDNGISKVSNDPTTVAVDDASCIAVREPPFVSIDCLVERIVSGQLHSFAIRADGALSAWGRNLNGQIGDGSVDDRSRPVGVLLPQPVDLVAGGLRHSLAATTDGRVWAWGNNSWGQLGVGGQTSFAIPVLVPGITEPVHLAGGFFHSLAALSDGSVWAWGYNNQGQLGDGSVASSFVPIQISIPAKVVQVAAGAWSSLALDDAGNVWAWGDNAYGLLGDGTTTDSLTPIQVSSINNVSLISMKTYHAIAATQTGGFWAWGDGFFGQLGIGTNQSHNVPMRSAFGFEVTDLDTGQYHSIAVGIDKVWTWGRNDKGQIGTALPSGCDCLPPPFDAWCQNEFSPTMLLPGFSFQSVAAGQRHSLALRPDGTLWAWGKNRFGELANLSSNCELAPRPSIGPCSAFISENVARAASAADSCTTGNGNLDGMFEPGERVSIDIGIRNTGGSLAEGFSDIEGRLKLPPPPGVVYVEDTVLFAPSPLPAGATADPDRLLVIELEPTVDCPSDIILTLNIFTVQGTFPIEIPIHVEPCAEQCLPPDCDLSLQKIDRLLMVKDVTVPELIWQPEVNALEGYRAYGLTDKTLIPTANQPATTRQLECSTADPSLVSCLGLTPWATGASPYYYQIVGTCGNGLEGPIE